MLAPNGQKTDELTPLQWAMSNWDIVRQSQAFVEHENDRLIVRILKHAALPFALTFGTPLLADTLPITHRPFISFGAYAIAAVKAAQNMRKVQQRDRNLATLHALRITETNIVEDQVRDLSARPPMGIWDRAKLQLPQQAEELNLNILMNATFLIIWGAQGSGKTTFAKHVARLREQSGHAIRVLDPHGSALEWSPWEVVGSGRNYDAIEYAMQSFDNEVTQDYDAFSNGQRDFPRSTLLCDEFTAWSDNCESSPKFIKSACSDLRKIKRCVIVISHNNTLTTLGNAKGLKGAINRSAIQLQLLAELGHDGEYHPTGFGWLTIPGTEEPIYVKIPNIPDSSPYQFQATRSPKTIEIVPGSYQELPEDEDEWDEDSIAFDEDGDRVLDVAATAVAIDLDVELATAAFEVLSQCIKRDATLTVRDLQRFGTVLRQMTADDIKTVVLGLSTAGYGVVANEQLAPSACTFTINKVHEQAVIYKLWQSYRKGEGGVEEFVRKVWGVRKLDDRYKPLMRQLFNAIEQHLYHWIPLLKREEMSITKAVWKVWHRDSRMRWMDDENNLNFNDLKQLLRNNGWSDEAIEAQSEASLETKE